MGTSSARTKHGGGRMILALFTSVCLASGIAPSAAYATGDQEPSSGAAAPAAFAAAAAEGDIPLDETTFPDEGFREYVLYYVSGDPDKVTQSNADACEDIDLSQTYYDIESLKGIEYFKNLETLEAQNMSIASLDLSANTKLTTVDLSDNPLTTLNVSGLSALQTLNLAGTALTALDLSSATSLATLSIGGTSLAYLGLSATKVSAVDTAGSPFIGSAKIEVSGGSFDLKGAYPGIDPAKMSDVQGAALDAGTGVLSGIQTGTPVTYSYDMGNGVTGAFQLVPVSQGSISYSVTFDAAGADTTPTAQVVVKDGKVSDPGAVSREGYTLQGWFAQGSATPWNFETDVVTADTKLTARWSANTYAVRYHANGAQGSMADQQMTYDAYASIEGCDFTWENHEFLGWSATADGKVAYKAHDRVKNLAAEAGAVVDLYAVWQEVVPEVGIPVDEEHFPDPVFRAWVLDNEGDILSDEEIEKVTSITIDGVTVDPENPLKSMEGLSYFKNLTYLKVTQSALTELDLSVVPKLQQLWIDHTPNLGEIDVTMLADLEILSVDSCGLSELDVTKNPKLDKLYAMHNQLTELDLSQNPVLDTLHVSDNRLATLDLTHNPILGVVSVHTNQLTSIAFPEQNKVESLFAHTNRLQSLDVSALQNMFWLEVQDNDLSYLDVSANKKLSSVKAWGNPLAYVNLPDKVDSTNFDFDDEGAADAPYAYEAIAPNGVLKLSSLGSGTMDPARVIDVQGAVFDADEGEFRIARPAEEGATTQVTYAYMANDGVKVRFSASLVYANQYQVTFDSQGGSDVPSQDVIEGGLVEKPADPTRDGYVFKGWVVAGTGDAWDFAADTVSGSLTLQAVWEKAPEGAGAGAGGAAGPDAEKGGSGNKPDGGSLPATGDSAPAALLTALGAGAAAVAVGTGAARARRRS